ncbi:uncharacterized protein ASPGLDRAFT_179868 [Aspergillus glaucus CBS 516.65]|uniref:Major facilitator superfamily (MFS) profile domain-containing protein n=1 Tax=Aspergillus glaucus CBS 516.65 TaxID=1160497 RepID=A0A1L9V857_ASPGL|nr:hypothetical protein ASPGLDRAFT_179868 [Aspergillus glaucus CBS 516.65]OJJ80118.1 hypothetical protein ASPGLDRAFT_179868 [Aspergillus glaucus CBS 516.65]
MAGGLEIEEKGDITSKEIENAGPDAPFWSPEEEKALVRKIDLVLLPMVWIMYLLSYMDRTNIGNAKISGMETDLDLTSNQYSIALVVFFIGYVVFEVPSNMLLSRIRPSLFLSGIMALWGALTCVMGAIKNFKQLVALRAIIGCVEAGFAPGVLMVIASWYRRTEQAKRFGIYISAAILSGAFGGLLAAVIVKGLEGAHGIRGWRWLFIVEGAATVGVALIAAFVLPDFPATSKSFSGRQRSIAVARLADDVTAMTQDSEQLSPRQAMVDSVKNWRTWMFVVGYMVIVGSSTLSYFYPTLIEGLFGDSSTERTNFLTIPIYGVAFVCTLITSYFSDKIPSWRGLIISCWLMFSLICSIAVCAVYDYTARYALLVLMASGLWTTNGMSLAYASSAFSSMHPQTRGISLALVNALGNLAQIYGSYLFPDSDGPKYTMGFSVISAMLALGVVVYLALHFWFRHRAKQTENEQPEE